MEKRRVEMGQMTMVTLPYSEAAMHMRVAGKEMRAELLDNGVQLYDDDARKFSFPITHGEAGFHLDDIGWYTY